MLAPRSLLTRKLILLLTLLVAPPVFFTTSSSRADFEPRKVAKTFNGDIPPGMHLVVDRAGLKWLLPEDMDTPPNKEIDIRYFVANSKPQVRSTLAGHEVLSGPLSSVDTVVSENENDQNNLMQVLPPAFADVLRLEKQANLHAQTSNDLLSLGVFSPNRFVTFKVPFIPIPKSEMEFAHISDYASAATRNLVEFNSGGVDYIRFFILPNFVDSTAYVDLIEKYGIVYQYEAMTTSSPRSLIVVDPVKPSEVHWIKPSLHRVIDGSLRINTDKKARRAIIMSEAIHAVPSEAMRSYHLRFMLEPAAFQAKAHSVATIHREVAPELLHPAEGKRWIPAFVLQNTGADAVPGLNIQDMAKITREPVDVFIRERLLRPLLHSYLSMGYLEGLPGELHTQNFYYEVAQQPGGGYLPTGEVMFKDNDGFRYDTELAMRRGRNMEFFARFDEPFSWGKFSNTLGLGGDGVPFLGSWYYKLIRNVSGFETMAAYMLRAINQIDPSIEMNKEKMQRMMDDVAAEEAAKITGVAIDPSEYGYGFDKGLNFALNRFRMNLAVETDSLQKDDPSLQTVLQKEWMRLAGVKRASAQRRALPKDAFFILHKQPDGALIIEARTPRTTVAKPDPVVGYAMVESKQSSEGVAAYGRLIPALLRFEAEFKRVKELKNAANVEKTGHVDAIKIGVRSCRALFL